MTLFYVCASFLLLTTSIVAADEYNETQSENITITSTEAAGRWSCPEGWDAVQEEDGKHSCVWFSQVRATHDDAHTQCEGKGSTLVRIASKVKDDQLRELMKNEESEYWIGLRQVENQPNREWRGSSMNVTYLPDDFHVKEWWTSWCGMYFTFDSGSMWNVNECSHEGLFICERKPDCREGTFGEQCEGDCHCHGDTCSLEDGCPFGCQPGWMGTWCEKRKEKIAVTTQCFNSQKSGKYVFVKIDTKGTKFREVYPSDWVGNKAASCDRYSIKETETGYNAIFYAPDSSSFYNRRRSYSSSLCAWAVSGPATTERHYGRRPFNDIPDAIQWRLALREYPNTIVQESDTDFLITCNFRKAETFSLSSSVQLKKRLSRPRQISPVAVKTSDIAVVLQVVDPATGQVLNGSSLGHPVVLEIRVSSTDGFVREVSPFDCKAISSDGEKKISLITDYGCKASKSPVGLFHKTQDVGVIRTDWFPYFTLGGADSISFSCSFMYCLKKNCDIGCNQHYYRRRHEISNSFLVRKRREAEVMEGTTRSVSTTIRLLPGISAQD